MPKAKINRRRALKAVLTQSLRIGLVVFVFALPVLFRNPTPVQGAPSTTLNFQARLLGNSGAIVADGNYHIEFKLYNVSSGGSALWTETRTGVNRVSVKSGYLSVYLGSVTAFPSTINWNEEHWLTMNIGGAGGSASWDGEMSPRLKLTAVPYAFQAEMLAKSNGSNRGTLGFNTVTNNPQITLPDATGTVCLANSSACGFATGAGAAFLQNGNNFGGNAVLGTTGAGQTLSFITANTTRLTLDASGNGALTGNLTVQGTGTSNFAGTVDVAGGLAVGDNASAGGTPLSALTVNETYTGTDSCTFICYGASITSNANGVVTGGVGGLLVSAGEAMGSFTVPKMVGVTILDPNEGSATITENIGLQIQYQGAGQTDYGLLIEGADTYSLWVDAGATRLDGTLEVQGNTTLGNAVSDTTTINGNVSIAGTTTGTDTLTIQSTNGSGGEIHGSGDEIFSISSDGTMYIVPNRDGDVNGSNRVILWDPAIPAQDSIILNASTGDITTVGSITLAGNLTMGDGSSATGKILYLDQKGAGDPIGGVDGAMYYSTATNSFRCYGNGTWGNCGNVSLQHAYGNLGGNTVTTTDNRNVVFSLADTATDSDFIVDILGTGNTFEIRDGGVAVFTVSDGGAVSLSTLGAASNDTVLCRNGSNQIATCSSTFATTANAFLQGGNNFGGTTAGTLGTTNNGSLNLITNNATRLTIDTSGNAALSGTLTVQGAGTSSIAGNLAVDTNTLYVDATNNRVGIGTTAPTASMHAVGQSAQTGTGTLTTANTSTSTVTGTGTAFLTQLAVGDTITAAGQSRVITAINSNTSLTVYGAFNPVLSAAAFTYTKPNVRLTDSSDANPLAVTNTGFNGNLDLNGYFAIGNKAGVNSVATMNFDHAYDSNANCFFQCYGILFGLTADNPAFPNGLVGIRAGVGTAATGFTLTNAVGYEVSSAVLGAGSTITNNTGIKIENQTAGTNDYGIVIEGADTYALWAKRGAIRMATTSSADAFQLQNGDGANLLSVNADQSINLAANGGAETDATFTTNWTTVGTSTITRNSTTGPSATNIASGFGSVNVAAGTTANNGVRNNLASNPAVSTTHIISFSAKLGSGSAFTDLEVVYSYNGGTNTTACSNYSTRELVTTEWRKVTCSLTTPANAVTNADLIIRQPTAAGSARTFYIDNLNMAAVTSSSTAPTLRIGGPNSQGLTLLTLDSHAERPWTSNSNTLHGSMYYDTTLGKIQCYEADGWGACGGAPDNIVNLVPEYAGSVLNGTGVGTMTADLCSGTSFLSINTSLCGATESRNFYKWTSPQASEQTYSIYISYQLPATFNGFADANTIKLTARTSSVAGNNGVTFALYQANGTQCGSTTEVNPTNVDTWETTNLTGDETACSFQPNDIITFRINMTASSGSSAYASNFSFTTLGK